LRLNDLVAHPPLKTTYVIMENDLTDSRLKEQVSHLEETLEALLSTTEKLFEENTLLKQREKQLLKERADLYGKNDKIRAQVESMISRLKSMDNA
jgi:cell division protein ZapB